MTIVIFDGPDKTGKSTSASALQHDGQPLYNATKENYEDVLEKHREDPGRVYAFDRLDWFTHMVYRLSMPGFEWNDARVRTVFTAPDAHLVIKVHEFSGEIEDELYSRGALVRTNALYRKFANFLADMNGQLGYIWFRSVTIVDVIYDQSSGRFMQKFNRISSPSINTTSLEPVETSDQDILMILKQIDSEIYGDYENGR